ncbi:regulatory protein [Scopulibacillus darangshiensis]|uniref:Regulatory protein RecX n=1 Tax=Scopulibacillus darangshiensis TaxID=442528 RepID=A0A4R2NSY0_9BACL|nr:RecX family transcriptional regulator [Scopulibacillus darangshiensis]TCP24548.1 regulatory protein [Scopulibacillus darangshiensis]
MYKLSKIQVNDRKKGYFFIDLEESAGSTITLEVHEDVLVVHALRKGMELTQDQFESIKSEENQIKIYHLAINYLSYRMRTKQEMEEYLMKKGFQRGEIHPLIERLLKEKLLDDRAFAEAFVRTRIRLTTKGPNLILRELDKAGVREDDASSAISSYSFDAQLDNASKYLKKKASAGKAKRSSAEEHNRLSRLLMQRGYNTNVIKPVLTGISPQTEEDEWKALEKHGEKAARKFARHNGREFEQKVKQYLYRKGFPFPMIDAFVAELREEE